MLKPKSNKLFFNSDGRTDNELLVDRHRAGLTLVRLRRVLEHGVVPIWPRAGLSGRCAFGRSSAALAAQNRPATAVPAQSGQALAEQRLVPYAATKASAASWRHTVAVTSSATS